MTSPLPEHPNILITGSSGFIGSFLVEEAIARGMNVLASVRKSSNKKYLNNPNIQFLELDLSSVDKLSTALIKTVEKTGRIDYIIHNAGTTKANKEQDYFETNAKFTDNLLKALEVSGIRPLKFVFISSLAAFGPGNPDTYEPIKHNDTPAPITAYGKSKLKAEQIIFAQKDIPWLIIRPTAVFGPREKEIFAIFKIINRNIHPRIKIPGQRMSFIYVKDLTRAVLDVTISHHSLKAYFISDGQVYSGDDFGDYVKKHLGKKTLNIPISKSLLKFVALNLEGINKLSGKISGLNKEKALEMTSRNWICDIGPIVSDIGFKPKYNLDRAIQETAKWYESEGWL